LFPSSSKKRAFSRERRHLNLSFQLIPSCGDIARAIGFNRWVRRPVPERFPDLFDHGYGVRIKISYRRFKQNGRQTIITGDDQTAPFRRSKFVSKHFPVGVAQLLAILDRRIATR
jgi:hypothetical protein